MSVKESVLLLQTAAFGSNEKELGLGTLTAIMGYITTNFLGGWDSALKVLLVLMAADYATGVLGAVKSHSLSSETMFWGGIRKGVVIVVVALSTMCDQWIGGDTGAPILRTLALYFYAGREGLSVVENLGVLGVPMPPVLTRFLAQLQEKGERRNG